MHLIALDHISGLATPLSGLSKIASLIDAARQENADCPSILLDNGDLLQGSAMADVMVETLAKTKGTEHPLPACIDALGYDAIGLGNHDLDYGFETARAVLGAMPCPVLCANARSLDLPFLRPYTLITRNIVQPDGSQISLQIAVLSALPTATQTWNARHLGDGDTLSPPLPILREWVPKVKARGADLVVVLAHSGLAARGSAAAQDNFAVEVADIAQIDAIICGHTHRLLPGPDHTDIKEVDTQSGHILDVPAVMPGAHGGALGVIDLSLTRHKGTWKVLHSACDLHHVTAQTQQAKGILDATAAANVQTHRAMAEVIGRTDHHLHGHFAMLGQNPVQQLIGQAMIDAVQSKAAEHGLSHLPVIAATSSAAMGGMGGPNNFFNLPPGPVQRRHASMLAPFQDEIWAVEVTGATLFDWLERSAFIFSRLNIASPEQPLIQRHAPSFNFDSLIGLEAVFDPSGPAKFDDLGKKQHEGATRVPHILWHGQTPLPEDRFLVAATSFRASGGGHFPDLGTDAIRLRTRITTQEVVRRALSGRVQAPAGPAPWRFRSGLDLSAVIETSPAASAWIDQIDAFAPRLLGLSPEGFLRIQVQL